MPTREETPNLDKLANGYGGAVRAELSALKAEVARLVAANEHWHLRVNQMLAQTEALTDEAALLRKKAAMAEEIARLFRGGHGYPLRPLDAAWLSRWSEITKEEQDG